MRRRFGWLSVVAALGAGLVVTGVSAAEAVAQRGFSATIRYTEYGVPHVLAENYASLGFGQGYAAAHDNLCVIADGTVTLDGRRSRFHGPDALPAGNAFGSSMTQASTNLASDLYFQGINDSGVVERLIAQPAPLGPTAEVRELVRGYVAGYNRFRREEHPSSCAGAAWLGPMTELDVYRRQYAWGLFFGQAKVAESIISAQPPASSVVDGVRTEARTADTADEVMSTVDAIGSNGIALGSAATANGRGMLLGNPHLGWHGDARLWQVHLTIPGRLNVIGAAPVGLPFIFVGHNETVAWTGTAATPVPYTLFQLTLVAGSPTTYLVDGRPEPMRRQEVTVTVRQPGGSLAEVTRTQWWTRYGPVVGPRMAGVQVPWTDTTAYALADANTQNMRLGNTLLAVGKAGTTADVVRALRDTQGNPSFNILAADAHGDAAYADIQVVPHVTDEHAARCNTSLGQLIFPTSGLAVLDGSRSSCGWGRDPDALQRGTFGPHRMPVLRRADQVANSNESHWLTNPDQLLAGYPRILGAEGTERFPRTRSTFTVIADQLADGGFTPQAMRDLMLANRNHAAELTIDGTIAMCRSLSDGTAANSAGDRVDLSGACRVLAAWDRRNDIGSRGALLFDRYWRNLTNRFRPPQWAELWQVPFDPADPVHTPNTLKSGHPALPTALADAVTALGSSAIALDAPLGDHQYVIRDGERIPLGGAGGRFGTVNNLESVPDPATGEYVEVQWGSTYIFVTAFDGDRCPDTRTLLTYSQSAEPTSANYTDQTKLYSRKMWVTERFCEKDILAAPSVRTVRIAQR